MWSKGVSHQGQSCRNRSSDIQECDRAGKQAAVRQPCSTSTNYNYSDESNNAPVHHYSNSTSNSNTIITAIAAILHHCSKHCKQHCKHQQFCTTSTLLQHYRQQCSTAALCHLCKRPAAPAVIVVQRRPSVKQEFVIRAVVFFLHKQCLHPPLTLDS